MKSGMCSVNRVRIRFALCSGAGLLKTPVTTFKKSNIECLHDYVQYAAIHFQISLRFGLAEFNFSCTIVQNSHQTIMDVE